MSDPLNHLGSIWYHSEGKAAYCPSSQLVPISQLALASFKNGLSSSDYLKKLRQVLRMV